MGLDDQLNNAKHGLTNKSRQNIGEDTNTNQPTDATSLEGPDIEVPTNEPGGTPKVGSLGAEDDEHDESASAGSESTLKIPNDFG